MIGQTGNLHHKWSPCVKVHPNRCGHILGQKSHRHHLFAYLSSIPVHEDRGRLARRCPQGVVATALPVDALETGIDLKATISGRTPPEPPQLWLIGMAREWLHPVVPS